LAAIVAFIEVADRPDDRAPMVGRLGEDLRQRSLASIGWGQLGGSAAIASLIMVLEKTTVAIPAVNPRRRKALRDGS